MKRKYERILKDHLDGNRQMAFVVGPRQVGKTTCSQQTLPNATYFNWDYQDDRLLITKGPAVIADKLDLSSLREGKIEVVFDEIHKYANWKSFLKGFFDVHGEDCKTIVTGSARLNVHKYAGDSLMGRYFLYRIHPLSVAEIANQSSMETELSSPTSITVDLMEQLMTFGGFPEPFLKGTKRFYNRWRKLRLDQLFQEDVRELTQIHEIYQLELLAHLVINQSGSLANYSSFAKDLNVSVDTIRRWLSTMEMMYFSFSVRPWFRNIPKSLRKQPKIYLWDWSQVMDRGARHENFVASHLLKAVHWWQDIGLGDYDLFFVRDKNKREVDFLVTKNNQPWFLVEVKSGTRSITPSLHKFHELLGTKHAFQVSFDMDYVDVDCFTKTTPTLVPASTFLSQLV